MQNQTLSLESDVETTNQVLDQQDGPTILVGHSYGGVVITEAGGHDRVAGLVYIAAFAPDAGESVNTLIADPPPGAPVPPILPPVDGFLLLDREKFADSFAADLPAELAAFSGPCPSEQARPSSRRPAATRSTSRSRTRLPA